MTSLIDAWLGDTAPLSTWSGDADRAHDVARHIAEKSASITAYRGAASLGAQTVRLEPAGGAAERTFQVGVLSKAAVVIVGYKGHPTITDTNLQRDDTFKYNGNFYTVRQVLPDVPDRLLALAEARDA